MLVVLRYLRHNLSQALLGELFGCSQPAVSRLVGRLVPAIATVPTGHSQHVADRELRSTVRVDGFLAPTGDRREHTYTAGMYSGRRHRCGFNVQVVGSHHGTLVLTGAPQPGAVHDARAWRESGLAERFTGRLDADGGPGGRRHRPHRHRPVRAATRAHRPDPDRISPRRQPGHRLLPGQHRTVIAHRKNWKLLATGYHGLLDRFPAFLDVITKLEIYRIS